ncbi:unnamed protein product, partial [marine sediment metagenome]
IDEVMGVDYIFAHYYNPHYINQILLYYLYCNVCYLLRVTYFNYYIPCIK